MANTNSTIFEISGTYTCFPFPTLKTGTIETVGKDVMGTGTLFEGFDSVAIVTLGGTVDAMNSISVAYQTGGSTPSTITNLIGATVPAAVNLNTMASDIASAINLYASSPKFYAVADNQSIYIYPEDGANGVGLNLTVVPNGAMTAQITPFAGGVNVPNITVPQLRGQQWIWNSTANQVAKVDFVRDNVSAHLKDAFVSDIAPGSAFYTIEENHWHSIEFLNVGTAPGFIDGVSVPQGVTVGFNKGNQDGFGSFNMIDPKVIDATSTTFIVTVY